MIFQDWKANKGNVKSQVVLVLFRIATIIRKNIFLVILFFPYLMFYRLFIEWLMGIELPWKLRIGKGLRLEHGQALVVHGDTKMGEYCTLRQSTTIGVKKLQDGTYSSCPEIGNNVDIGTHVCIIGNIKIGDNVIIGAGAVVVKDVPSNSTAVGNPAKVIGYNKLVGI